MSPSTLARQSEGHTTAARLAQGLADMGDATDAVGFVESQQRLQARYVDGRLTACASTHKGGFSRTVLSGGRWAMAAAPWREDDDRGQGGLDAVEMAAVRTSFTARDESLDLRLAQLGTLWSSPPSWCTTEAIADVVTRRRAVARRGQAPHVEVSRWTRLRWRLIDLRRGVELDRRQWVGRGTDIDRSAVPLVPNDEAAVPAPRTVRPGRHVTAVVLEGSASACLLHELVGHIAEQDSLARRSEYADAVQVVKGVHPDLNVMDDPHLVTGAGTQDVDDEGTPTTRTEILSGGRFASGLGTLMHPSPVSGAGSARRSSYAAVPMPRASNTVVKKGTAAQEELFAGPEVLVVTGFASGYVVPTTGDFQFVATRCHMESRNGPPIPVGDVLVNGNALDVLRSISAVGSDLCSTAVTCGKRDQWVVVSMVSPSVRIEQLEWSCG